MLRHPDARASESLPAEIQEFARQRMAAYKCPRQVEFLDVLPKTPSGKIKRKELRQRDAAP